MKKNYLVLILCYMSYPIYSQSQDFGKKYKLNIDSFIKMALKQSDFTALQKASLLDNQSQILKHNSIYDPNFYTTYTSVKDSTEKLSTFMGGDSSSNKITFGSSKNFITGTTLKAELYSSINKQNQTLNNQTTTNSYDESGINLTLHQNLWKNIFGKVDKNNLKSAKFTALSNTFQIKRNIEDYIINLITQYYQAKASSINLTLAIKRESREIRRLNAYKRQFERGFMEKKNFLQLKTSLLAAQAQKKDAQESIYQILATLQASLKIDLLSYFDGLNLNIEFPEDNIDDVMVLCKTRPQKLHSYNIDMFQNAIKSAEAQLISIKNKNDPDLFLEASINANSIDDKTSNTLSESFSLKNPKYIAALGIKVNLGSSAYKSSYQQILKLKSLNEIKINQEQTTLKTDWQINCNSLISQHSVLKMLKQKTDLEQQRIDLLDKDFILGKEDLNTLIQAEEALIATNTQLNQLNIKIYQTAWNLRRLKGELKKYVANIL